MKQVSWNVFEIERTDPQEIWESEDERTRFIRPSEQFLAWRDEQDLFIDVMSGIDSLTLIFLDEEAIMLFKLTWFEGSTCHDRI